MSTLKVNTLSNLSGSKSVPTDTVVDGSAKARVCFNGTGTVAILSAFNVSSITDNGTGDYTANFTTAFADINYSVAASGPTGNGRILWPYTGTFNTFDGAPARTVSSLRVSYRDNAGSSPSDATPLDITIFR